MLSIVSGCFHIDAIKNYKKIYDRLQIVFDLKEIYLLFVNFVASDFFFLQIMKNVSHMIKLRMLKNNFKNRD